MKFFLGAMSLCVALRAFELLFKLLNGRINGDIPSPETFSLILLVAGIIFTVNGIGFWVAAFRGWNKLDY